jgi:hypothetical protein
MVDERKAGLNAAADGDFALENTTFRRVHASAEAASRARLGFTPRRSRSS